MASPTTLPGPLGTPPRAAAWLQADLSRQQAAREAAARDALQAALDKAYRWLAIYAAALLLGTLGAIALDKYGLLPKPVTPAPPHPVTVAAR